MFNKNTELVTLIELNLYILCNIYEFRPVMPVYLYHCLPNKLSTCFHDNLTRTSF